MKVLVTGCFGFIGFNFLNYIYKNFNEDFQIVGIDSLESSCSKKNQEAIPDLKNFQFFAKICKTQF